MIDISSVTKVKEVRLKHELNQLIDEGWILLSVIGGQSEDLSPYFVYSLGWIEDPLSPTE